MYDSDDILHMNCDKVSAMDPELLVWNNRKCRTMGMVS